MDYTGFKNMVPFSTLAKDGRQFISTITALLSAIVLIVVCTPIYFLRFLVSKLRKLGPNLGKIVNPQSSLHAVDDIFENPMCSLVVLCKLKGPFSPVIINFLRKTFTEKVIFAREENEELKYPEMQQYPYQWLGFLFWKWDKNFDISHHINFYYSPDTDTNSSSISQKQLDNIQISLVMKEFEKNRSPWEILVIQNVESDTNIGEQQRDTVVLFRFHHSLVDGRSIINIIFAAFCNKENNSIEKFVSTPKIIEKRSSVEVFNVCKNILLTPYQFTKYFLESTDRNEWTSSSSQLSHKTKRTIKLTKSEIISLRDLKEIAKFNHVGLTTVILSGLTAALRKSMIKNGASTPEDIHVSCPTFIPGHPDKLTNHSSVMFIRLPISDVDPLVRLRKIEARTTELKNSYFAHSMFYTASLIGGLFPFMIRYILKHPTGITTVVCSSFPGPKQKLYINNQPVTDCYCVGGALISNYGIMCGTVTYCDGIRLIFGITNQVLESVFDTEEVVEDIKQEFRVLKAAIL